MSHIAMPSPDQAILQHRNELLRELAKLVPGATLIADQVGRRTFETDALTAYRSLPLAVLLPGSTEEVSAILRFCHDNHIKVVPRGAGTSLSGGEGSIFGTFIGAFIISVLTNGLRVPVSKTFRDQVKQAGWLG